MIKNITKNTIIAEYELVARSLWDRGTGLIYKKFCPEKLDALIFEKCGSIHTFFMNYKFDVFFIDKSKKVVKLYKNASPWRIYNSGLNIFEYCTTIECPAGSIDSTRTAAGDYIEWNNHETENCNENKLS